MNLRQLAESDLTTTLEDSLQGFGWPAVVTDPAGTSLALNIQSGDISELIDPDTGLGVSGRYAHAVIRVSTLIAGGLGMPVEVSDVNSKPWVISFDDINLKNYTFKISEPMPDRTLGIVACKLEIYEKLP